MESRPRYSIQTADHALTSLVVIMDDAAQESLTDAEEHKESRWIEESRPSQETEAVSSELNEDEADTQGAPLGRPTTRRRFVGPG